LRRGRLEVNFATSNRNKFLEAQSVLAEHRVHLIFRGHRASEIQSDSIEEIARHSAKSSCLHANVATVAEDAGLFIDILNGFPGPYSSFVFRKLGCNGILKLLDGSLDRKAKFVSAVAFCEPSGEPVCFTGTVEGAIATEARGTLGFGFDPIFVADEAGQETFGEMTAFEKGRHSHRAKAFRGFAKWFVESVKP